MVLALALALASDWVEVKEEETNLPSLCLSRMDENRDKYNRARP